MKRGTFRQFWAAGAWWVEGHSSADRVSETRELPDVSSTALCVCYEPWTNKDQPPPGVSTSRLPVVRRIIR